MAKRKASDNTAKQPTKSERIVALLATGMTIGEIRHAVGCSAGYVQQIKFHGLEKTKQLAHERCTKRRRYKGITIREEFLNARRQCAEARAAPIVAAIRSGISYAEAAEKFGLKKTTVHGIMQRHGRRNAKSDD